MSEASRWDGANPPVPLTFVELDGNENAPQRRPHGPSFGWKSTEENHSTVALRSSHFLPCCEALQDASLLSPSRTSGQEEHL